MRLSVEQFRAWENKCVTLLGMSGVGKTRLAALLRRHNWFHYSGDYRIGTRYLDEPILDNIKQQAMQVPFLRDLLRSDSIYIANNITVDHLKPLSTFLGKLGAAAQGGLPLAEFKRRQDLHRRAEIAAMRDVPEFICKAQAIYGYQHFVNDAGGSLCELDDPEVLELLDRHTLVLYIDATNDDARALIARAEQDPKPLYYREAFLEGELASYMEERGLPPLETSGLAAAERIDPDDFVRWVFPRLFCSRLPRYQAIAARYGYSVSSAEVAAVTSEEDFLELVARALARPPAEPPAAAPAGEEGRG